MNDPFARFAKLQERLPSNWLEAYDIDLILVLGIVGADPASIVKLSNRLIEDTAENRHLPVGRGKVVPPADAKTLTVAMLNACSVFGLPPPDRLLKLNEMLLGADVQPRAASKKHGQKNKAFAHWIENPKVGVRAIARELGVSSGTASEWLKEFRGLESRVRARLNDK